MTMKSEIRISKSEIILVSDFEFRASDFVCLG